MYRYEINERKSVDVLRVVLVVLLVFFNIDTLPATYYPWLIKPTILLICLPILILIVKIINKDIKLSLMETIVLFTSTSLILISMFLNVDFRGGYFQIILNLLIGYMYVRIIPFHDFCRYFVNILIFLAAYSLIALYVFRTFTFDMPPDIFPRFFNSAGLPFINARFTYVVDIGTYYRNFGIFREPGVYQIFLNFALAFELFVNKRKPNLIKVLILTIAILSTLSTPGYVSAMLIILTFIIKMFSFSSKTGCKSIRKTIFVLTAVILITVIFFISSDVINGFFTSLFDKVFVQKTNSLGGRLAAVHANIRIWSTRPIFGHGLTKGSEGLVIELMKSYTSSSSVHNTSTTGAQLASFGIVFTSIFTIALYNLVKNLSSRSTSIIIFLSILITINTQNLIHNELLYTFMAYGVCLASTKPASAEANSL